MLRILHLRHSFFKVELIILMTSRMMGPSSPQPKQKMQTSSISNNFVDVQDKRTSFGVRNMFTEKQLRSYEPDNYRPSKRFHEMYKSVSESTF